MNVEVVLRHARSSHLYGIALVIFSYIERRRRGINAWHVIVVKEITKYIRKPIL